MLPPAITMSSLASMPCLVPPDTVRLPLPLIVRSSRAKITPPRFSVSAVSDQVSPLVMRFSVPSASVRKTLSACSTRKAESSEQVMSAPSSRIQTLAER